MQVIRSVSVRTRLLAALLFASIAPAVFVGLYAYRSYTRSIAEKLADTAVQTIRQLDNAFSTELMRYTQFIDQVSVSEVVQESLLAQRGGAVLRREVDSILIRGGYFRGLRVVDRDGLTLYDDGRTLVSEREFSVLLRNAEAASTADGLYYIGGPRDGSLTIGRKIFRFPLGREHIGYVFAFISDAVLLDKKLWDGVSLGGGGVALLSADGTVLAGSVANPGELLTGTELYELLLQAQKPFRSEVDGVPSLIVFSRNARYDAYLLAAIPLSYINAEAAQTGLQLILFVAVAAILCMALSLWIYRSVASPIHRIVAKCRDTPPEVGPIGDDSPDELGFLSRAVDQYTADLEAMAQMRVVDQRRKRELELEALQYQVNPHFLFNTLGTLKWVSIINDAPPVISEGIDSLSELLRSVLLSKDEMIPIREELENLAHYFMIQRIRYAECFEVVHEIDETVADSKIPRFILQPLAENAILHGSEGGTRQIVITVRCARAAEGVLLEIRDDGNGFDPDTVRNHHEGRFSGIGLSNVDERLKLYFGDGHGLDIRSRPGEGTVCRLWIPDHRDAQGGEGGVPGPVCG